MKNTLVIVALFLGVSSAAFAQSMTIRGATYNFDDPSFKSIFDRTLIMGHILSADLLPKPIRLIPTPGDVLAEYYAGKPVLANISEPYGMSMETGLQKISRWLNQEELLDGTHKRRIAYLDQVIAGATAIVGVDAFYLDVVFNTCADESNVPLRIASFVDQMHAQGKVLILGNVPSEDWSKVPFVQRLVLENKNESCRQEINKSLREFCTPAQNCYVIDLEMIVYTLNSTGELVLKSGQRLRNNRFYVYNEVRFDGISLTSYGVQVIVEDILKSLAANPPQVVTKTPFTQP